ncbi:MAG TPA: hypothetical protein VMZ53_28570, partial [Kofleriaceae bacterium]|nr:hypothetical protein [Kofleriaceae bacterium]
ILIVTGCMKSGGGASFSTENGTSSGGGGGGGGEGDEASGRNTGDTSGLSLEERKYWRGQEDYLFRSIDAGPENCGVKFSFQWDTDRKTFRDKAEANNNSPYSICASMVDEVTSLCREGEDEKQSVAAKIKGFRCGYGHPRKATIEDGIVVYMGNHEESNFSDWAKPWLTKNL